MRALLQRPQPPPPAGPLARPPADEEAPLSQEPAEQAVLPAMQPVTRPGVLQLPPLRRLEGLALLLITALMWGEPRMRLLPPIYAAVQPACCPTICAAVLPACRPARLLLVRSQVAPLLP